MEYFYLNTYRKDKRKITDAWLRKNQFRRSPIFSVRGCEAWEYIFPCYRHGDTITLLGSIVIYEDGGVVLNCYDANSPTKRALFAPFYCEEDWMSHHTILEVVANKFDGEIKRLGIRLKKEYRP